MGATRITPDEIVRVQQPYNQYGSYAAVTRIAGHSAQTVAWYINLQGTLPVVKHTSKELCDRYNK